MKNRLLALACALALCSVVPASAQTTIRYPHTQVINWRDACSSCASAFVDTSFTGHAGGSNATRDTSATIALQRVAPAAQVASGVTDSTLWARIRVWPKVGSAITVSADSLYGYVEKLDPGGNWKTITNLTEVLALENGTSNAFEFNITYGRRTAELQGEQTFRFIMRGDIAGQYEGDVTYYTLDPQ